MFFLKNKLAHPFTCVLFVLLTIITLAKSIQTVINTHTTTDNLINKYHTSASSLNIQELNKRLDILEKDPFVPEKFKEEQKHFIDLDKTILAINQAITEHDYNHLKQHTIQALEHENQLSQRGWGFPPDFIHAQGFKFNYQDFAHANTLKIALMKNSNKSTHLYDSFQLDTIGHFLKEIGYFDKYSTPILCLFTITVFISLYFFKLNQQHKTLMQTVPKSPVYQLMTHLSLTTLFSTFIQSIMLIIYFGIYACFFGLGTAKHFTIFLHNTPIDFPIGYLLILFIIFIILVNLAITLLSVIMQYLFSDMIIPLSSMLLLIWLEPITHSLHLSLPKEYLYLSAHFDIGPILSDFKNKLFHTSSLSIESVITHWLLIILGLIIILLFIDYFKRSWRKTYGIS